MATAQKESNAKTRSELIIHYIIYCPTASQVGHRSAYAIVATNLLSAGFCQNPSGALDPQTGLP